MQDLIIIEPGRRERHYWRDLGDIASCSRCWRGATLGALQADGDRSGLGADPAVPDHGGLHHHLRPDRRAAVGRRGALCADGLCRHAAVDLLFDGVERRLEQPDQQCQSDQQGLLSAADRADRDGGGGLRRFPDQLLHPGRADGLVPVRAGLADSDSCRRSSCIAFLASLGAGPVDHGAQRQVSGFPLRHSVHRAVRPVCVAGRIQLEHRPGAMASCSIRSIRWWASSTDFAGAFLGGREPALSAGLGR